MKHDSATPLISVIIPCYNQAHFLPEAIESVLTQTYPHLEIIVVDDGSLDNSSAVASSYEQIRCIRQVNRGLSGARNTGIRESHGEFLVFLDSDDRLLPNALQDNMDCLRQYPQCGFVYGGFRHIDSDGRAIGEDTIPHVVDDVMACLLYRNHIQAICVALFSRRVLNLVGLFDISLKACEDYDLYLRVAKEHPIACHQTVVAEYRQHGSSMTKVAAHMLRHVMRVRASCRDYVRRNPQYEEAFSNGTNRAVNLYAPRVIQQIMMEPFKIFQAFDNLLVLLRYTPGWLTKRIIRKVGIWS